MNTVKFKILCNGKFIGVIFITSGHPNFPNFKTGTIIPYMTRGTWTEGDLELVHGQQITNFYDNVIDNDAICEDLIARSTIDRALCRTFELVPY